MCHLGKIEFLLQNDFPISLQEAISHHPQCQLDISRPQNVSTSVPSLKSQASPRLRGRMDDDDWGIDFNLLRLEGLHTLPVQIPRKSDQSGWIELDEMLPFHVLAPNLKHLLLQRNSTAHKFPITTLKQEWRNFASTTRPVPKSSLHSISIGQLEPREDILLRLADIVGLSQLRSLKLHELFDATILSQVAPLFPNLERLFISTNGQGWRYPDVNAGNNIGIAAIRAFNPLKYVHLCGIRSVSSLNEIIQHHGPSLKGLIIERSIGVRARIGTRDSGNKYPELDAFGISHLAKSCPQLEELRLPIKRSMGSQEECDMYKALGNFSNLYSLVLDLHFDPRPRPVDRMQEIETSVLKMIFVNAAMDEKLALQIWHLISSNQASRRLQNLRVVPFGLEFLPNDEHRLLIGSLVRF
jgi:hypothetical protein